MMRRLMLLSLLVVPLSCARSADDQAVDANANQRQNPAAGQREADSAPAEKTWSDEYDEMVSALELTAQDAEPLKAAFLAREEAVSAWMSEKGGELKELEQKMFAAAKSRDSTGVRQLTAEAKPLRDELRALIETHQREILKTLSPEAQSGWAAHRLAERLLEQLESLELTEGQIASIREKAVAAVAASRGEKNPPASGYLKLERVVENSVLTADQKQAFQAVKKKNPLRSLLTR